jgi:hypothetical protein
MRRYIMTANKWNYAVPLTTFFLVAGLFFAPDPVDAGLLTQKFDKILTFNNITFHVTCANEGSLNNVTIIPSGLEISNDPIIIKDADGSVAGAEVADINKDGSPEIYVYVISAGSGSYATLIAYSSNHNKSLSEIYLPPLADDKTNSRGYMGHDKFSIKDSHLVRSFPVYKDNDSNAEPSGGMRQLKYKLVQGEATWQLKLVKSLLQ